MVALGSVNLGGMVNRSLFSSQLGPSLESTIFLSNSTFCHGCICSHVGEVFVFLNTDHGGPQKGATSAYCFSVFPQFVIPAQ